MYARNELRVYQEFASELTSRGVRLPRVAGIEDRLDVLGDAELSQPPEEEPSEEALYQCGAMMFLECANGFFQGSPLSEASLEAPLPTINRNSNHNCDRNLTVTQTQIYEDRAVAALCAVAHLHAAAWEAPSTKQIRVRVTTTVEGHRQGVSGPDTDAVVAAPRPRPCNDSQDSTFLKSVGFLRATHDT